MQGALVATVGSKLELGVLALDAALYPTLLAVVVVLLNQPRRIALLGAYLAVGLTVSIVAGVAIVYVFQGLLARGESGLSAAIDVVGGVLALLLAAALATHLDGRLADRRRNRPSRRARARESNGEPAMQRILARGSAPLLIAAALVLNLPGAAYLIALKDIAAQRDGTVATVVLIVAFNACMFVLAEVPFAGLIVSPARTETGVLRFNAWLTENGRRLSIALCVILGVYLLARGITKL